jgi:hypothetical protein
MELPESDVAGVTLGSSSSFSAVLSSEFALHVKLGQMVFRLPVASTDTVALLRVRLEHVSGVPARLLKVHSDMCQLDSAPPTTLLTSLGLRDGSGILATVSEYSDTSDKPPAHGIFTFNVTKNEAATVSTEATVAKTGYLHKKGEINTSWRLRYWVLTGDKLCYYRSNSEPSAVAAIALRDANVVTKEYSEALKGMYAFDVITKTRVYSLAAKSRAEMLDWVSAIAARTSLGLDNQLIAQAEERIAALQREKAARMSQRLSVVHWQQPQS